MKSGQSSQLVSILLLFLVIVGVTVFVLPMREEMTQLQLEKTTLEAELLELDARYMALDELSKKVSQSETTKLSLLRAHPVGYEQDQLILDLTNMAEEAGFSLNVLSFSPGLSEEYGKTLTVATNITGSYDQMIRFLQSLESADRLMRVISMNVQRLTASSVAFNLQIEAYYQ